MMIFSSYIAKTILTYSGGVYLLPEKIPSGGSYNPGTAYILEKLFEDLEGRYFVILVKPSAGRQTRRKKYNH